MKIIAEIQKADEGVIVANYEGFIPELDLGKMYDIEIKEHKSKRSINQNALLWKLIGLIAKNQDKTDWDIYLDLMQNCNIQPEYILALPETIKSLKNAYRVVIPLDETREVNGKILTIFKCQIGSSKLNTKEFKELLDYTIKVCSELNIEMIFDL